MDGDEQLWRKGVAGRGQKGRARPDPDCATVVAFDLLLCNHSGNASLSQARLDYSIIFIVDRRRCTLTWLKGTRTLEAQ